MSIATDKIMNLGDGKVLYDDLRDRTEALNTGKVPTTRKVNGKALSSDVTVMGSDIPMNSLDSTKMDVAVNNLKSALKGNIDNVEQVLNNETIDLTAAYGFKQGGFGTITDYNAVTNGSLYGIYCEAKKLTGSKVSINVSGSGYRYVYAIFDKTGTVLYSKGGWQTASASFNNATIDMIRLQIGKSDGSAIDPSAETGITITCDNDLIDRLNETEGYAVAVPSIIGQITKNPVDLTEAYGFKQGGFSSLTTKGTKTNGSLYNIHCEVKNVIGSHVDFNFTDDDFKYIYSIWDKDGNVLYSNTGWQTTSKYFSNESIDSIRVVIARADGSAISPSVDTGFTVTESSYVISRIKNAEDGIDDLQDYDEVVNEELNLPEIMKNVSFDHSAYIVNNDEWDTRSYVVTSEPIYAKTDVKVIPSDGYQAFVAITDSTGETVIGYRAYTTGTIMVNQGDYFRVTFRVYPDETRTLSTDLAYTMGSVKYIKLSEIVDDLNNNSGAEDKDEIIMTKNVIAVPADFFIKDGDTSGRILKVTNPYEKQYANQYIGQTHDHTWSTEEAHTKQNAINVYNLYKKAGYDFMTITNYPYFDDITPQPEVSDSLIWLCNSYEQGRMPDVIDSTHQNTHIVFLNVPAVYKHGSFSDSINTVIDYFTERGVIAVLAHPMWYTDAEHQTLFTKTQLEALSENIRFVEVWNQFSQCQAQESPYLTNPAYALDVLASAGRKVWGTAVTDSHEWGTSVSNMIRSGNVKVFAAKKTRSDIWASLMNGNFYACEDIFSRVNSIRLDDNVFKINTGDAGASTKFYGNNATVLSTVSGANPSYTIQGDEVYVRAEITLSTGKRIWTNPIYLS